MAEYSTPDDAAAAFAWMLSRLFPDAALYEYASGIVPTDGGYAYSSPKTSRKASEFRVALPAAMQAIVHNHPAVNLRQQSHSLSAERSTRKLDAAVSDTDRLVAKAFELPSYIVDPTGRLVRYDPRSGATREVLAQFPIEEFRAYLMRRGLLR